MPLQWNAGRQKKGGQLPNVYFAMSKPRQSRAFRMALRASSPLVGAAMDVNRLYRMFGKRLPRKRVINDPTPPRHTVQELKNMINPRREMLRREGKLLTGDQVLNNILQQKKERDRILRKLK